MTHVIPFDATFRALTEHDPFPWQRALYERLVEANGSVPRSCDVPTGLGKTAVVAVWLIGLANHPDKIPRRLVYVVNRRTVVDQTTNEVEKLRANLRGAGLWERLNELCAIPLDDDEPPLAISTLRGQFADNRQWSADPARPAVVVGTVDMIGSRLLFSGYRVGFKAKPLHGGFLGQDVLLVHDEAHLEPAFQKLLIEIGEEQERCKEFGSFRVTELTATSREQTAPTRDDVLPLTDEERNAPAVIPDPPSEPIHHVWRRLKAKKALRLHEVAGGKAAEEIAKIALEQYKDAHAAVLIYVRTLDDVLKVCAKLTHKENGVSQDHVRQLTGTMRGLERDRMTNPRRADACRVFARFLTPPKPDADEHERWNIEPMPGTVYLVCTSAGEVGIDISADHMVSDLSTFESMAQRLGRVNRFGDGDAQIDVVFPAGFDRKDKLSLARENALKLLEQLPRVPQSEDEPGVVRYDASPGALGELKDRTDLPCKIGDAFSPAPTILPATDILFDAWALTTIRDTMPGRPPVAPYLHGVAEWEPPETHVAWREEVGIITGDLLDRYHPGDLLEAFPLKPHELLRDRSDRVFDQLQVLAGRHRTAPVWVVDEQGKVSPRRLGDIADPSATKAAAKKPLVAGIAGRTVLLPPVVGGLSRGGMLDGASDHADDVAEIKAPATERRVRLRSDDEEYDDKTAGMRLVQSIDPNDDDVDDDEVRPTWDWYKHKALEDSRTARKPVRWDIHVGDVVRHIDRILAGLALPAEIAQAVRVAAKLHDHGKRRSQFQLTLGNRSYPRLVLAKSGRNGARFPETYRHEFGSLGDAMDDTEFRQLSSEMQDVVLHLIAAGHGRARPHFPSDEAFDLECPQRDAEAMAAEVPRRFARLQRKYGRWGLAYLESLLRAADWAASAEPSEFLTEANEVSR